MPASPRNRAYSDHSQAARTPSETSVSIVAAPWRRFAQAARWNGHAPQRTTGVASWRASHCQLLNCSGGTIETSRTGRESSADTTSRRRRVAAGPAAAASAASPSGSASACAGSVARYPAAATAATRSSGATAAGSNRTVAFSVA